MAEDQSVPASEPVPEAQIEAAPPAIENVAQSADSVTPPAQAQLAEEVQPPPPIQEIVSPPAPSAPPPPTVPTAGTITMIDDAARARAYASVVKRIEERHAKIVALARQKGSIANASVVRLIRVSEATASRYLRALVSQGRLKAESRGRGRKYAAV